MKTGWGKLKFYYMCLHSFLNGTFINEASASENYNSYSPKGISNQNGTFITISPCSEKPQPIARLIILSSLAAISCLNQAYYGKKLRIEEKRRSASVGPCPSEQYFKLIWGQSVPGDHWNFSIRSLHCELTDKVRENAHEVA